MIQARRIWIAVLILAALSLSQEPVHIQKGFLTVQGCLDMSAKPCNRHSELLRQGHMDLGVRVATTNPALAEQFRHALDSWARILDLDWHEDDTQNCSIQLVDGERELFQSAAMAARSQLRGRLDFQGWIAFNPAQTLSETDLYRISVHEIGHVLGLQHSANAMSVMYFLNLEGLDWLDPTDLAALATHHKLRFATLDKPVKLTQPR